MRKECQKPYSPAEAKSRFDKQAAFCAAGGTPPWKGDGQWKMKGKAVGDPAGPFNPSGPTDEKKKKNA